MTFKLHQENFTKLW